ncbi:hypothetical protein DM02DRAFT_682060 [Periconia macrospinosa]|uniref:DUF6546 domain-containing protein n=1 Tax=Periconia macrospinosa TaxID=97972 RepID=A0A2V1DMR8_9PLEO|nr:hypothetical protein DM02DRAFT_682060 [Periconia macrospinosa]
MTSTHDHTPFPWPSLPADIRLLILDEISGQKHRGWAQCAAVCKEWQVILEPKNFSRLALQTSCLNELETLVIRQRPLVQHICLNIDLPRYGCPTCKRDAPLSSSRFTIFRRAILRLFSILSTWQPTGRLTLELSASSPSDSQHWFKNYCFGPGHEDARDWTQQEKAIRWHDPKHGWVGGHQVQTPGLPAMLRLFSPLCLNVPQNLPVVHAVTNFCIRRQLRHELFPEVLKALWEKLPRLENIVYELWRARQRHYQISCGYELAFLIYDSVPKHVKRVSIFKDFNSQLAVALNNATPRLDRKIEATSALDLVLARAFAAKSHHLEHLSISYMIDAQQFFTSCQKLPCTWNLLQSLILTSSTLSRKAPHQNVYTLLRNASLIALKMPRLKTMVLWNSGPGEACVVIYQRHTASAMATLTWRSTWDLELSDDVVESWKRVVPGLCYLRLEKEAIRDVDIRSHGDAIHHLRLPDGVVDPTSLCQIRQEGMMQRTA